ncbi:MAG: hypothetical protein MUQ60_03670, partial [Porticoccaceae bacterium]|nr:hypothetical protein [Porticoccaceae bacterium]
DLHDVRGAVGRLTAIDLEARTAVIGGEAYTLGPAFEPPVIMLRGVFGATVQQLVVGMFLGVKYTDVDGQRQLLAIRHFDGLGLEQEQK